MYKSNIHTSTYLLKYLPGFYTLYFEVFEIVRPSTKMTIDINLKLKAS